ncbi:PspC domain-containing protein [Arsenicicoccus cauae]|nr:PspC domain-containing protein [Arsenicicoccus cauae]
MNSIYATMRRNGLTRPRSGRVAMGVCAGIGRKLGIDANIVRLVFIASLIIPGSQVLIYLALMVLMPED